MRRGTYSGAVRLSSARFFSFLPPRTRSARLRGERVTSGRRRMIGARFAYGAYMEIILFRGGNAIESFISEPVRAAVRVSVVRCFPLSPRPSRSRSGCFFSVISCLFSVFSLGPLLLLFVRRSGRSTCFCPPPPGPAPPCNHSADNCLKRYPVLR